MDGLWLDCGNKEDDGLASSWTSTCKGSYVWISKIWVFEKEPYMDFWNSKDWNVTSQEKCDLENL
jgi:hypothetical protein